MKAEEVLPTHLLEEIHKYFEGGIIYVPKKSKREGWGALTGTRKDIKERNEAIIDQYESGIDIEQLSSEYYLSVETIRKIVYGKK